MISSRQSGCLGYIYLFLNIVAQRSAHESPVVERQDVDHCSVLGGLQMILTGQNFTSDSRVLFTEKTQGMSFGSHDKPLHTH